MTVSQGPPPPTTPRPRRPWGAAILSILVPGLGHVYGGAPRRALFAFVAYYTAGTLFVLATAAWPSIIVLASGLGFMALLIVIIAWDSARTARGAGSLYALKVYNRWFVYTSALLLSTLVVSPTHFRFLSSILRAYQMPSVSMEPTLLRGDYVLARPLRQPPSRGDLVIYRDRAGTYIKRIIGLPTDTVSMRGAILFVNGHSVLEPYTASTQGPDVSDTAFSWQRRYLTSGADPLAYQPTRDNWGPILVPDDAYFILGDNRGNSYDSRHAGFVSVDSVVQEPVLVYFSRAPEAGVRWYRIGVRFATK